MSDHQQNHNHEHHHHEHHHHEHHDHKCGHHNQHDHHKKKVEENQTAFDKKADSYDTEETLTASKNIYNFLYNQLGGEEVLLLKADATKVLNFGCGTGLLEDHLRHNVHSIVGIDISDGMIQQYKSKIVNKNWTNVTGYQIDILNDDTIQPFEEESFDIVISSFVFHHVADINAIGTKLMKYLKPGGVFCIFELRKDSDTDSTVDNLLQQTDKTTQKSLGHHHGFTASKLQSYFEETLQLINFQVHDPGAIIHRNQELPVIYVQGTKK